MTGATVARWARRYVATSVVSLVGWQAAVLSGLPRRIEIAIAVFGFVLPMIFGKAYSLVPSYFDRDLKPTWAPAVQFPLTVLGAAGLIGAGVPTTPSWIDPVAAASWGGGVVVFVGAIAWTVRDNPLGAETGTSEANADRRRIDRMANVGMPIALGYLLVGSYTILAVDTGLPTLFDGYRPRSTHLFVAGVATLLMLSIGFRLLPRFLVGHPPEWLAGIVLPAGIIGPLVLAASITGGPLLIAGAVLEAIAVVGFAAMIGLLFLRTDRDRVGFYGVLAGAVSGVVGVVLGLHFAVTGQTPALTIAHYRLNLLGFLGLTVVGVAFQFYPPGVGSLPGIGDRSALAAIGCLAAGLGLQVVGVVVAAGLIERGGSVLSLIGALLYAWIILGLFYDRYWSRDG
ncbi:MAG: hypothetical protein SVG88_01920 [Halobacteriales archaeon]|nr:hypothetical protein [Halobacteriales archaeon]